MKICFRRAKGQGSGNQFMARGLLSGLSVFVRREIINLYSYIKKTIDTYSPLLKVTDLESNIVKTMSLNSFIKKEISLTSDIDRVRIT